MAVDTFHPVWHQLPPTPPSTPPLDAHRVTWHVSLRGGGGDKSEEILDEVPAKDTFGAQDQTPDTAAVEDGDPDPGAVGGETQPKPAAGALTSQITATPRTRKARAASEPLPGVRRDLDQHDGEPEDDVLDSIEHSQAGDDAFESAEHSQAGDDASAIFGHSPTPYNPVDSFEHLASQLDDDDFDSEKYESNPADENEVQDIDGDEIQDVGRGVPNIHEEAQYHNHQGLMGLGMTQYQYQTGFNPLAAHFQPQGTVSNLQFSNVQPISGLDQVAQQFGQMQIGATEAQFQHPPVATVYNVPQSGFQTVPPVPAPSIYMNPSVRRPMAVLFPPTPVWGPENPRGATRPNEGIGPGWRCMHCFGLSTFLRMRCQKCDRMTVRWRCVACSHVNTWPYHTCERCRHWAGLLSSTTGHTQPRSPRPNAPVDVGLQLFPRGSRAAFANSYTRSISESSDSTISGPTWTCHCGMLNLVSALHCSLCRRLRLASPPVAAANPFTPFGFADPNSPRLRGGAGGGSSSRRRGRGRGRGHGPWTRATPRMGYQDDWEDDDFLPARFGENEDPVLQPVSRLRPQAPAFQPPIIPPPSGHLHPPTYGQPTVDPQPNYGPAAPPPPSPAILPASDAGPQVGPGQGPPGPLENPIRATQQETFGPGPGQALARMPNPLGPSGPPIAPGPIEQLLRPDYATPTRPQLRLQTASAAPPRVDGHPGPFDGGPSAGTSAGTSSGPAFRTWTPRDDDPSAETSAGSGVRPPPGSGVEAPEPPRPSPPPPGDGHLFSPADTPIIRLEAAAEPAEETGNPWDRGETLAAKIRKMKD